MAFILVLFLGTNGFAETRAETLVRAKIQMSKGQDEETVALLKPLVLKRWKSKEGEEAAVLLSEAYLRIGDLKNSNYHARRFYKYYTNSQYLDRILWIQVRILLSQGEYFSGARKAFTLLHRTQSKTLYKAGQTQLMKLLQKGLLNNQELENLLLTFQIDNDLVSQLRLELGKLYTQEERYFSANYQWKQISKVNPNSTFSIQADSLLQTISSKGKGKPTLLVVGPMSGDLSHLGEDMLQGVSLALDQLKEKEGNFHYRKIDTRGEPALAVTAVRRAINEDYVVGVIGPIMSHAASAVAAWLSVTHPDIPLITPTATDDGIGSLGYNVFQFNLPTAQLARDIARYSVLCEGLYEFAVLAPLSDYGEIMAREFSLEVKKYGGRIMGTDYYEEGLEDYAKPFGVIKALQYRNYRQRELISWGNDDKSDNALKRGHGDYMKDSVVMIDGFFIPAGSSEDAAQLARELSYHNIKTQMLGADGWYGKELLRKGRKYVNDALFAAPFLERNEIKEWDHFKSSFEKKWSQQPDDNRVSALSYDATKFIIQNLGEGSVERMRSKPKIEGVYGPLYLDKEDGSNNFSQLVKIVKGKYTLPKTCKEFQQTK